MSSEACPRVLVHMVSSGVRAREHACSFPLVAAHMLSLGVRTRECVSSARVLVRVSSLGVRMRERRPPFLLCWYTCCERGPCHGMCFLLFAAALSLRFPDVHVIPLHPLLAWMPDGCQ
jgi:hypothetical protein